MPGMRSLRVSAFGRWHKKGKYLPKIWSSYPCCCMERVAQCGSLRLLRWYSHVDICVRPGVRGKEYRKILPFPAWLKVEEEAQRSSCFALSQARRAQFPWHSSFPNMGLAAAQLFLTHTAYDMPQRVAVKLFLCPTHLGTRFIWGFFCSFFLAGFLSLEWCISSLFFARPYSRAGVRISCSVLLCFCPGK